MSTTAIARYFESYGSIDHAPACQGASGARYHPALAVEGDDFTLVFTQQGLAGASAVVDARVAARDVGARCVLAAPGFTDECRRFAQRFDIALLDTRTLPEPVEAEVPTLEVNPTPSAVEVASPAPATVPSRAYAPPRITITYEPDVLPQSVVTEISTLVDAALLMADPARVETPPALTVEPVAEATIEPEVEPEVEAAPEPLLDEVETLPPLEAPEVETPPELEPAAEVPALPESLLPWPVAAAQPAAQPEVEADEDAEVPVEVPIELPAPVDEDAFERELERLLDGAPAEDAPTASALPWTLPQAHSSPAGAEEYSEAEREAERVVLQDVGLWKVPARIAAVRAHLESTVQGATLQYANDDNEADEAEIGIDGPRSTWLRKLSTD